MAQKAVKAPLRRLAAEIGLLPLLAIAILCGSVGFLYSAVKPLERRVQALEREVARGTRRTPLAAFTRAGSGSPEHRLAAFYSHLERSEDAVDWLAKLHGIAKAQGLESRAGDYRLEESRHRLDRYRINLPFTGSYAQIRKFLALALSECPVLSIDQVTFKRRSAAEPRVDAEIGLTLYLRRPKGE